MNDFSFRPVEAYNFIVPKLPAGRYLRIGAGLGGSTDAVDPVENRINLVPFALRRTMSFDRIDFGIPNGGTPAGDASCQARLGVYQIDPELWLTAPMIKVFEVLISSGLNSVGVKGSSINQTLPAGAYLGACIINRNGGSGAMPRPTTMTSSPVGQGGNAFGEAGPSPSGAAHGNATAAYKDETIMNWSAYTLPDSISSLSYTTSANSAAPFLGLRAT